MEKMEEENSIPWDGGGAATPKKKGRRRKTQETECLPLPEEAVIEKDEQAVADLQADYRIITQHNTGSSVMAKMEEENSIPWDGGGAATPKKKGRRRKTQETECLPLPEEAIIEKDEQAVADLQADYRITAQHNTGSSVMEEMEEENSIPWDGGGAATPKKRGRRRKMQETEYLPLPEEAVIEKDEQAVAELQAAYRILQSFLRIKNIGPFNEEPTADKFGMSSYFSVIKNPMWLNEVRRKIESGEYEGLHEFVKDVHLMLYNCYKFWGFKHRISSRGYVIERKLETKLQELPWSIREKMKCPVPTDECVICSIPEDKKMQEDELLNALNADPVYDPDLVHYNSRGYTSKIIVKVMEEDEDVRPEEEETEETKEIRLKMERWEEDVLNELEGASSIPHIPELVDIGVFLKATHEVLNVEEITQYEVERMLLIPEKSSTLQTLMTSIFSPELKRATLDDTPLMPYQVWNSHIRKTISTWCDIFYNTCDMIETCKKTGIEPYFWSVIHLVNPMDDNQKLHDLPFYVRVWILKSLLDNLARRQKSIFAVFSEDKVIPDNVRHIYLGKGALNHHYKAVPCFLPEIRVYRENSVLTSVWNGTSWHEDAEEGIFQLQRNRMTFAGDTLQFGPNLKTFVLKANDSSSLVELLEEVSSKNMGEVVEGLVVFKSMLDQSPPHIRCEGLKSVYKQYHDAISRTSEFFANQEAQYNFWFQCQGPIREKETKKEDFSEEIHQMLGKRRSVPNRLYNEWSDHGDSSVEQEEASESEVSDWELESSIKNHLRHKKLKPASKSKKFADVSSEPSTSQLPINGSRDSTQTLPVVLANSFTLKKEATEPILLSQFKMEPSVEPAVQNGLVKVEKKADSTSAPGTSSAPKKDDVVVIIDSDEEDVKPPITKIKLRDMSTLLETTSPTPPPICTSPAMNPMLNSMLNNTLNVVIPMNAINPVTNTPMSMNMNVSGLGPLGVQVPPNLYQRPPGPPGMTPVRHRVPGPLTRPQMMGRGAMRGMIRTGMQRPQMNPRSPMRAPVQRQMTVPKPITPKKPVPRPMMMSPQEWARTPSPANSPGTPPNAVGRGGVGVTPRGRSPATPPQAAWAGRGGANRASTIQPKTLFQEPPKAEGKITMGQNELGNGYCYQIVLDDGGIRFLTDTEVTAIKRKHGGALPRRIAIPPDGSFM